MYTDTEGIVLRQTKSIGGRRMIVLLSEKYGKISAGTSISEKGKNRSAYALRPFTYGKYELFKNRDSYSINAAETVKSFYEIGEDFDKFYQASYILELTDRLLEEEQPAKYLLELVVDYLELLKSRKSHYDTLTVGFMLKALNMTGCAPQLESCTSCGAKDVKMFFSVQAGGLMCEKCGEGSFSGPLVYDLDQQQLTALRYISAHGLRSLETLALQDGSEKKLRSILKSYYSYHLGIDKLKSEGLIV